MTGFKRFSPLWLTLGLGILLVANNAGFYFRQPYDEYWDSAANSLRVIQAKHFAELYGPYSHWGFSHPGPALFYLEALGEWLFYDLLRWTPAPFNGQLLLHALVMAGFYVAALQLFARRMADNIRWWFLALALCAGVWHFGDKPDLPSFYNPLGGPVAFLSNWSAHALALPFLCLLAAAASVAAGDGRDLPLLVLAGGFLVHTHVAQPLFVVPVAAVAYGVLLARGMVAERRMSPPNGRFRWWPGAAWRANPRAHLIGTGLLACFLLPLVLDLFKGRESNFAAILRHLHTHKAEHKTLARSVLYFLQFGAYQSYRPGARAFGHYDLPGALAYLRSHVLLLILWSLAAAVAFRATLRGTWTRRLQATASEDVAGAANGRFLAWCGTFLFLSVAITLYWGTIQDGEMFYYNAWFNFAIYYFALLIALAAVCQDLRVWLSRMAGHSWARLAPAGLAVVVGTLSANSWRVADPAAAEDRAVWENTLRAWRATDDAGAPHVCKSLVFADMDWYQAVGVALQLERAGEPCVVPEAWEARFGVRHSWRNIHPGSGVAEPRRWRFEGPDTFPAQTTSIPAFPFRNGTTLNAGLPPLELTAAQPVAGFDFKTGGNATDLMVGGWFAPESWGAWSDAAVAIMEFCPQPVAGGEVELRVDAFPMLMPARGVTAQRARVFFNGAAIGPEQRLTDWAATRMFFHIPAVQWNQAATAAHPCAALRFEFPDAFAPAVLDPAHCVDIRTLGMGFHRLEFRWVP